MVEVSHSQNKKVPINASSSNPLFFTPLLYSLTSSSSSSQPHTIITTMSDQLSKTTTSIFGLNTWVVAGIILGVAIVLLLFFLSLCLTSKSRRMPFFSSSSKPTNYSNNTSNPTISIPQISKEIQEIVPDTTHTEAEAEEGSLVGYNRVNIEIGGKDHRISCPPGGGNSSNSQESSGGGGGGDREGAGVPEVSHLGWGHWYTLRELESCTGGFDDGNVIGEGGYGIVYYGVFDDGSQIAVKNLLNNR